MVVFPGCTIHNEKAHFLYILTCTLSTFPNIYCPYELQQCCTKVVILTFHLELIKVEAFTAKTLTEEYKSKQDLPKSLTTTSDLNTNRNPANISATSHIVDNRYTSRRSTDLNTSNHSSNSSSSSTSTNIQDKIIKEKKSECDIDCDLVLTCLTHIWHILTVITQVQYHLSFI